MFRGLHPVFQSARKVPLCSTPRWPMVISRGNLWTMETWEPCRCVKICVVNHTRATLRLWREDAVSLSTVTARRSVCGCQPKTTSTCCNFPTSQVPTVFRTAVSCLKTLAVHCRVHGFLQSSCLTTWPFPCGVILKSKLSECLIAKMH